MRSWAEKIIISDSAYAILSRNNSSRQLCVKRGGGEPKDDMMTRGRGGGAGYPQKVMTSFMNSPLFEEFESIETYLNHNFICSSLIRASFFLPRFGRKTRSFHPILNKRSFLSSRKLFCEITNTSKSNVFCRK